MEALESSARASQAHAPSSLRRANQIAESIILGALLAVPALTCLHGSGATDPDVWWHLRTGEWILTHHAVPYTDPFTSFGAGKPWQAYSWLFEVLVLKCFQHLGLAGILAYTMAMVLAITAALHRLIRRLQPDFSASVLLTLVGALSLMRLFSPRPWLFTILFFIIQLDILMQARRTGKLAELLWLPILYMVWANIHIQFVDGLIVLALALAESCLSGRWASTRTRIPPVWFGSIFTSCLLATLINPYGWTIYKIAYCLAAQSDVMKLVGELQAPNFRMPADYGMLFLALCAAATLAAPAPRNEREWRRPFPLFETALLVFAALVSFRTQRDMWVLVISASAILAQQLPGEETRRRPLASFTAPVAIAAIAIILFIGVRATHSDNAHLRTQLAGAMPVHAVEAIKANNYSGPIYNTYNWGGYLIWDLRMPVSVDGRAALSGDNRLVRSYATWNAQADWASDPDLQSAGLVIGPVTAPLTQLLRTDPRFQLAYEDNLAAVFTARRLHEPVANNH